MTEKIFLVEGMTCKHCKARIENSIKGIPGVEEVEADNLKGQVSVTGSQINEETIKSAVENAGYRFMGSI